MALEMPDLEVGQLVIGEHRGEIGDRRGDGIGLADHLIVNAARTATCRAATPSSTAARTCGAPAPATVITDRPGSGRGKLASTIAIASP